MSTIPLHTYLSRSERLFLLGCVGVGGITGWNRRLVNTHTASVEYVSVPDRVATGGRHEVGCGEQSSAGDRDLRVSRGDGSHGAVARSIANGGRRDRPSNRDFDGRHTAALLGSGEFDRTDTVGGGDVHHGRGIPADVGRPTDVGSTAEMVATDESTAAVPPAVRVQRVLGRQDKVDQLIREQEARRRAREHESQSQQSENEFAAALAQANHRERDGPASRMRQRPEDFTSQYYRQTNLASRRRQDHILRRVQVQAELHPYRQAFRDSVWFEKTLTPLKRATPDTPGQFVKRQETVHLPHGARAVFNANTGEAILEVMLRTSCHLQIVPVRHDSSIDIVSSHQREIEQVYARGFASLSVYGTPEENEAALALLPSMVTVVSVEDLKASKDLRDYTLRRGQLDNHESVPPVQDTAGDARDLDIRYYEHAAATQWSALTTETEDVANPGNDDVNLDTTFAEHEPHRASQQVLARAYWHTSVYEDGVTSLLPKSNARDEDSGRIAFRRPEKWTTVAFAQYIRTLTKVSARLERRTVRPRDAHQPGQSQPDTVKRQIIAEMLDCFADVTASASISSTAVDTALSFLVKHAEYPPIRQLLAVVDKHEAYRLTPSNFNILLHAAALKGDAHNFRLWMRGMLRRGLKPSWKTWTSFYQLVGRRYAETDWPTQIFKIMDQKGVLSNVMALDVVVRANIELELDTYLKAAKDADLDSFVRNYDSRYTFPHDLPSRRLVAPEHRHPWLSVTSANIMAKVFLAHGRTQDALAVVRMLEVAGQMANVITLNTFLTAALHVKDAAFAIEVLRHFVPALTRAHRPIRLNERSYVILFHIARYKQCLNMLRVVWRYACCAGHVDWKMQYSIEQSLLSYWPPRSSGNHRAWEREDFNGAVVDVLGGHGKKLTESNKVAKEVTAVRSRRGEVFFSLAGKFAIGVLDGLEQKLSAQEPSDLGTDALGMRDHELLTLAAQPRNEREADESASPEYRHRKTTLMTRLKEDLEGEVLKVEPIMPVHEMLEKAWELDMRWHKEGIGMANDGLRAAMNDESLGQDERAGRFKGALRACLEQGIEVSVAHKESPWVR